MCLFQAAAIFNSALGSFLVSLFTQILIHTCFVEVHWCPLWLESGNHSFVTAPVARASILFTLGCLSKCCGILETRRNVSKFGWHGFRTLPQHAIALFEPNLCCSRAREEGSHLLRQTVWSSGVVAASQFSSAPAADTGVQRLSWVIDSETHGCHRLTPSESQW